MRHVQQSRSRVPGHLWKSRRVAGAPPSQHRHQEDGRAAPRLCLDPAALESADPSGDRMLGVS